MFLHDRGIVHCDVKTGNILHDRGYNKFVLTDMGMAGGKCADYPLRRKSAAICGIVVSSRVHVKRKASYKQMLTTYPQHEPNYCNSS